MSRYRNENQYAIFITAIILLFFSLTLYVKIKNDCRELTHENFSLEQQINGYGSIIKSNYSEINDLISRNRIENLAKKEFNLISAEPESIIIFFN